MQVFQSTDEPQEVKERAFRQPGQKSAPAPKEEAKPKEANEPGIGDLGIDPRAIALPGACMTRALEADVCICH